MTNEESDSTEDIDTFWDHLGTPVAPRQPMVVVNHSRVARILGLYSQFIVPFNKNGSSLFVDAVYLACVDKLMLLADEFLVTTAEELLQKAKIEIGPGKYMIDVLKDVAIPLVAGFVGNVLPFDIRTARYEGEYNLERLYQDLLAIRIWSFANDDPALAGERHRNAQKAMDRLVRSSETYLSKSAAIGTTHDPRTGHKDCGFSRLHAFMHGAVCRSLEQGVSEKELANSMISAALSLVGPAVTSLAEILHFLIANDQNSHHLAALRDLILKDSTKEAESYILEIQRLTNAHSITLMAAEDTVVDQQRFSKGDAVTCRLAAASKDPAAFPDPDQIRLDRPRESYLRHTPGTWALFEQEMSVAYFLAALKHLLTLEGLSPVPGEKGVLKKDVPDDGGNPQYPDETGSSRCAYASTWKLQFHESS